MTDKVVIYGISNCDSIRKARRWLNEHQIEYTFHDYRKQGLAPELLASWCDQLGWQALLNKRGTTFRQLSDEIKNQLDQKSALKLMLEQPAMIKRPLLITSSTLELGFNADTYQSIFGL